MEHYLEALRSHGLPIPVSGLAVLWLGLLGISYGLLRLAGGRSGSEPFIASESRSDRISRQVAGRLLFGGLVFAYAGYVGGAYAVFFAGGWVVMAIVLVASSIQEAWVARALSRSGAGSSEPPLSRQVALAAVSMRLFAAAVLCLALGLLLPHLALLGAALFLAAAGIGYFRMSKSVRVT